MNMMVGEAIQYAAQRLHTDLVPTLYYHSLAHTRDDVVVATECLADRSAVDSSRKQLLVVAAWYHDLGFVVQRNEHEQVSAQIAADVLPSFGFHAHDIRQIMGMIYATKLPQSPQTLLEALLADADLDVLGRTDFPARNQALRDELRSAGVSFSDAEWYHQQYTFLANHCYWTAAARDLRDVGKQRNLQLMERRLAEASY